jgi:hypothetical protein
MMIGIEAVGEVVEMIVIGGDSCWPSQIPRVDGVCRVSGFFFFQWNMFPGAGKRVLLDCINSPAFENYGLQEAARA